MTAQTRTASQAPGFTPSTIAHPSTARLVVIAASFLLEAVIVLGFVSSSVGLGAPAAGYPEPGLGRLAPPAQVTPVSAIQAKPAPVLEPAPAPAPAP